MAGREVRAGGAYVEIGIRNRIAKGAAGVQSDLKGLAGKVGSLGKSMTIAAGAVGAGFAWGASGIAKFDDAIRAVGAISRSSEAELAMLTATAKDLGRTTSFTAVEVAALMTELGRAGFSAQQIDDMTGSVLALSRATGTDAAQAAGIMSATIRQFGMDATDAGRVADVLTAAANNSFNSVESLGEALTYAGTTASDMGMSVEETAALLGTLGNVGIQGSSAGTALKRLLTLSGAEATKLEGIFGVAFKDSAGNARPLLDVLGEVGAATEGLGTADRAAKFNEAFGLLGITAASSIGKAAGSTKELLKTIQGSIGGVQPLVDMLAEVEASAVGLSGSDRAEKFSEAFKKVGISVPASMDLATASTADMLDEFKSLSGVAKTTAETMDGGLGGSFRKMMSAVEGVQLAIGSAIEGPFQLLADKMIEIVGVASGWIEKNQGLIKILFAGTAAVGAAGAALLALGGTLYVASAAVGVLTASMALFVSPIGLAVAAMIGLGVAIVTQTSLAGDAIQWLNKRFGNLVAIVNAAVQEIVDLVSQGEMEKAWEMAANTMELVWLELTGGIQDLWGETMGWILDASSTVATKIGEVFQSLASFLGGLLDSYRSLYDGIYNFTSDKLNQLGGTLTGVETIGGPATASSAFDAQFGGLAASLESTISGINEFGAAMSSEARGQISNRMADRDQAKVERTRRVVELSSGLSTLISAGEDQAVKEKVDGAKKAAEVEAKAAGETIQEAKQTSGPSGTFSAAAAAILGSGNRGENLQLAATKMVAKNTAIIAEEAVKPQVARVT